jgi:hypothetical protein
MEGNCVRKGRNGRKLLRRLKPTLGCDGSKEEEEAFNIHEKIPSALTPNHCCHQSYFFHTFSYYAYKKDERAKTGNFIRSDDDSWYIWNTFC